MRKAPAPPPARKRVRHTTEESQVLFSAEQVAALRELSAKRPRGTPAPVPALATAAAEAVAPSEPATVEVLATFPPVQSLYSVTAIPVRDPLWRRPALFGGALAGLLVGLAAWGVGWGREHLVPRAPAAAAIVVEPPVTSPMLDAMRAPEPAAPSALAPPAPPETTIAAEPEPSVSETPVVEPTSTRATRKGTFNARTTSGVAPRPTKRATASTEPIAPSTPPAPVEAAAATMMSVPALSPIPPAAAPGLDDAIAAASAKEAPAPPLADAPTSQPNDPAVGPFSRDAALAALTGAAGAAARCRSTEGPFGSARVAVTFSPTGTVTTAIVEGPPFAGTPVGSCIARTFRGARVTPFAGGSVTVHKNVTIF